MMNMPKLTEGQRKAGAGSLKRLQSRKELAFAQGCVFRAAKTAEHFGDGDTEASLVVLWGSLDLPQKEMKYGPTEEGRPGRT